jgi:peroxin-4
MNTKRLMREAGSFRPSAAVLYLSPVEDRLDRWVATISGPVDTPYQGGRFDLIITLNDYPISPPEIFFKTSCCHPNIEFATGKICLDLLNSAWSPSWNLCSALEGIVVLLSVSLMLFKSQNPQPDSPLNCDVANLLRDGDIMGYNSLIQMYTALYAQSTLSRSP